MSGGTQTEENGNRDSNVNNNKNELTEQVGQLQQQMKEGISKAVDNKSYIVSNPGVGGY